MNDQYRQYQIYANARMAPSATSESKTSISGTGAGAAHPTQDAPKSNEALLREVLKQIMLIQEAPEITRH